MNHTATTTLGIFAVLTATMIMVGALVVMPAFATSGDGNTFTKSKNKSKTIASGFGTTALNTQSNCINFVTATGCPVSSGSPVRAGSPVTTGLPGLPVTAGSP